MGKNVLILFPSDWRVEECCVKQGSSYAPTAALVLAAYLRKLGHSPLVAPHPTAGSRQFNIGTVPDALVIYAPWSAFTVVSSPMIQAVKKQYANCVTIMVMYETLSDFEKQAMNECPELDYAILPNEKEISVKTILEHGEPRCPGGFGEKAGIIYRDNDGIPKHNGKRPYARDLSHLPYFGNELTTFINQNPNHPYKNIAVLLERGCPQGCNFCPVRTTRVRYRDPEIAISELETAAKIFGKKGTSSLTHEVFLKKTPLEGFADTIIKRNADICWDIGARCDLVDDLNLLKKLKKSGVNVLYFGIESATETGRKQISKPIKDIDIERSIALAGEAGLGFHAAFMIGFPWENENYAEKMKGLLGKIASLNHCQKIVMSQLVPFPGLPIETELVETGVLPRLTTFGDWNHPTVDSVTTVTKTVHMDSQTYTRYVKSIYNP